MWACARTPWGLLPRDLCAGTGGGACAGGEPAGGGKARAGQGRGARECAGGHAAYSAGKAWRIGCRCFGRGNAQAPHGGYFVAMRGVEERSLKARAGADAVVVEFAVVEVVQSGLGRRLGLGWCSVIELGPFCLEHAGKL